jgi:hypothetical protein
LESAVLASVETLNAFESAVDAWVAALSAALRTKLFSFNEALPADICALTALSTVEPAVTLETAADPPVVMSPALNAFESAVEVVNESETAFESAALA